MRFRFNVDPITMLLYTQAIKRPPSTYSREKSTTPRCENGTRRLTLPSSVDDVTHTHTPCTSNGRQVDAVIAKGQYPVSICSTFQMDTLLLPLRAFNFIACGRGVADDKSQCVCRIFWDRNSYSSAGIIIYDWRSEFLIHFGRRQAIEVVCQHQNRMETMDANICEFSCKYYLLSRVE